MKTSSLLKSDLLEQLAQQLPGAPHERQPLLVLRRPGRLAYEHQLGVGVAGPEDDRPAGRGELGTARAGTGLCEHLLERLAALGGGGSARGGLHRRMLDGRFHVREP